MQYVARAKHFATLNEPLMPWDVTHPLGLPAMLAFLMGGDGSLTRFVDVQLVISCLVPLAVGLARHRRLRAPHGAPVHLLRQPLFPLIEFGAQILSEIHLTFWLTLAFTALFAARGAPRRSVSIGLSIVGGFVLSLAASLKSVALAAALTFFTLDALGLLVARDPVVSQNTIEPRSGRIAVAEVKQAT